MIFRNPFRQSDENTRTAWGYTFQWTPEHLTPEQMHPLKFSYDVLAEECLERLDRISPPQTPELPRNRSRAPEKDGEKTGLPALPKRDLYELLKEHASEDEKLNELWTEVNTVPEWVDWDQISRGQEVFYRYGGVAITALAYQSLLGGMGANRVVETLARTGGFGVKVAKHRMYETTQHILQVTKSLDSVKPGGAGHISSIRVRLLHAAVRHRILKLAAERPEYYDVSTLGVPINDLDSVATIGTFSATLIWLGFPRQGIYLRQQEITDYIALWRLIAHYLGTPTSFFATPAAAQRVMESLLVSEIQPTATSRLLAGNIIRSLADQAPTYASADFLCASARWLNGHELADELGLMRPGLYYYVLVAGQCIFFMTMCYVYRAVPYLDKRKIAALRRIFYAVIVENQTHGLGVESSFEFKYIPDFHTTTVKEEHVVARGSRSVERRNLKSFLIASAVVGALSIVGLRVTWNVAQKIFR